MPSHRVFLLALVMMASTAAATAATIQDSRGTYIQDRNGTWHKYVRVQPIRSLPDPYASNGQYQEPFVQSDIAKGRGNW